MTHEERGANSVFRNVADAQVSLLPGSNYPPGVVAENMRQR